MVEQSPSEDNHARVDQRGKMVVASDPRKQIDDSTDEEVEDTIEENAPIDDPKEPVAPAIESRNYVVAPTHDGIFDAQGPDGIAGQNCFESPGPSPVALERVDAIQGATIGSSYSSRQSRINAVTSEKPGQDKSDFKSHYPLRDTIAGRSPGRPPQGPKIGPPPLRPVGVDVDFQHDFQSAARIEVDETLVGTQQMKDMISTILARSRNSRNSTLNLSTERCQPGTPAAGTPTSELVIEVQKEGSDQATHSVEASMAVVETEMTVVSTEPTITQETPPALEEAPSGVKGAFGALEGQHSKESEIQQSLKAESKLGVNSLQAEGRAAVEVVNAGYTAPTRILSWMAAIKEVSGEENGGSQKQSNAIESMDKTNIVQTHGTMNGTNGRVFDTPVGIEKMGCEGTQRYLFAPEQRDSQTKAEDVAIDPNSYVKPTSYESVPSLKTRRSDRKSTRPSRKGVSPAVPDDQFNNNRYGSLWIASKLKSGERSILKSGEPPSLESGELSSWKSSGGTRKSRISIGRKSKMPVVKTKSDVKSPLVKTTSASASKSLSTRKSTSAGPEAHKGTESSVSKDGKARKTVSRARKTFSKTRKTTTSMTAETSSEDPSAALHRLLKEVGKDVAFAAFVKTHGTALDEDVFRILGLGLDHGLGELAEDNVPQDSEHKHPASSTPSIKAPSILPGASDQPTLGVSAEPVWNDVDLRQISKDPSRNSVTKVEENSVTNTEQKSVADARKSVTDARKTLTGADARETGPVVRGFFTMGYGTNEERPKEGAQDRVYPGQTPAMDPRYSMAVTSIATNNDEIRNLQKDLDALKEEKKGLHKSLDTLVKLQNTMLDRALSFSKASSELRNINTDLYLGVMDEILTVMARSQDDYKYSLDTKWSNENLNFFDANENKRTRQTVKLKSRGDNEGFVHRLLSLLQRDAGSDGSSVTQNKPTRVLTINTEPDFERFGTILLQNFGYRMTKNGNSSPNSKVGGGFTGMDSPISPQTAHGSSNASSKNTITADDMEDMKFQRKVILDNIQKSDLVEVAVNAGARNAEHFITTHFVQALRERSIAVLNSNMKLMSETRDLREAIYAGAETLRTIRKEEGVRVSRTSLKEGFHVAADHVDEAFESHEAFMRKLQDGVHIMGAGLDRLHRNAEDSAMTIQQQIQKTDNETGVNGDSDFYLINRSRLKASAHSASGRFKNVMKGNSQGNSPLNNSGSPGGRANVKRPDKLLDGVDVEHDDSHDDVFHSITLDKKQGLRDNTGEFGRSVSSLQQGTSSSFVEAQVSASSLLKQSPLLSELSMARRISPVPVSSPMGSYREEVQSNIKIKKHLRRQRVLVFNFPPSHDPSKEEDADLAIWESLGFLGAESFPPDATGAKPRMKLKYRVDGSVDFYGHVPKKYAEKMVVDRDRQKTEEVAKEAPKEAKRVATQQQQAEEEAKKLEAKTLAEELEEETRLEASRRVAEAMKKSEPERKKKLDDEFKKVEAERKRGMTFSPNLTITALDGSKLELGHQGALVNVKRINLTGANSNIEELGGHNEHHHHVEHRACGSIVSPRSSDLRSTVQHHDHGTVSFQSQNPTLRQFLKQEIRPATHDYAGSVYSDGARNSLPRTSARSKSLMARPSQGSRFTAYKPSV